MGEFGTSRPGISGFTILAAGIAVAVLGAAPILLYALVGPADGNPVGLGLLMVVAVPVGAILAVLGLVKMIIESLVGRAG